jgi:hypothetical protein
VPVRGISPADTRADREHRVAFVVLPGELRLEARRVDLRGEDREIAFEIGGHRRVVREGQELGEIVGALPESVPTIDARTEQTEAFQDLLRLLPVVPEIGATGLDL